MGSRLAVSLLGISGFLWTGVAHSAERVIGGIEVPEERYPEVVMIESPGATCTATLVGPQVLLTAGHCGNTGDAFTATIAGVPVKGTAIRNPEYPAQDSDVAVVLLPAPIVGIHPITIAGSAAEGELVTMIGYGCNSETAASAGTLRLGQSKVTKLEDFDVVTDAPNGAALCFGDSGGPALAISGGHYQAIGVASKGNIKDTSYFSRLDHALARKFLESIVEEHKVEICGISPKC